MKSHFSHCLDCLDSLTRIRRQYPKNGGYWPSWERIIEILYATLVGEVSASLDTVEGMLLLSVYGICGGGCAEYEYPPPENWDALSEYVWLCPGYVWPWLELIVNSNLFNVDYTLRVWLPNSAEPAVLDCHNFWRWMKTLKCMHRRESINNTKLYLHEFQLSRTGKLLTCTK